MDLNNEEVIYSSEKCKITKGEYNGKQCIKKTGSFSHEAANAIARINSPYIPHIYEIGDDYITSEYVDGADLSKSKISPQNVLSIALELCDALAELHKNSVIHRDIKPSNIILCGDGHIKLIDFDAARIMKIAADKDTAFIGTDGFAPPEQFGFTQTDERSDIYSFGVTIKLLLGDNYARSAYKSVIEKCIRFDPARRYKTIAPVRLAIVRSKYLRFAVPVAAVLGVITAVTISVTLLNSAGSPSDITSVPENSTQDSSISEPISSIESDNITSYFTENREVTWSMLALPDGFPKLAEAVTDYHESGANYYITWYKMNDAEFDEIKEKLKTWLGTTDDGEFSEDRATEKYDFSTEKYDVSLQKYFIKKKLPHIYNDSDDYFNVNISIVKHGDVRELPSCGFDFADPSAKEIGNRPLHWEDTALNGTIPKLSENVTEVEENSSGYVILWDKMTLGELGCVLREITDCIGTSQCEQRLMPIREMIWEFPCGENRVVVHCDSCSADIFYNVRLYISLES